MIHGHTSRMVIGEVEKRDEVYYFCSMAPTTRLCRATNANSYKMWHWRLGHSSSQIVGILYDVSNNDFCRNKDKPCNICFKAKQTRTLFPTSHNKANDLFELMYVGNSPISVENFNQS